MEGAMRRIFANGLALTLLAATPAFADKPVEPAETAHHSPEPSSFFRPAAKPKTDTKPAADQSVTKAAPKPETKAAPRTGGPSKRVIAQQEAIKAIPFANGDWRGPSKVLRKEGWAAMTETQHVETLAEGTIRTIESKGY